MKMCEQCGAAIPRARRDQRFCTLPCRRAFQRKGIARLTATEARIYAAIVNADGQVVSHAELVQKLGYRPSHGRSDSVLLRTHIHNIRRKVGKREIGTWLFGYYWTAGEVTPARCALQNRGGALWAATTAMSA